jgi:hypothetical protein
MSEKTIKNLNFDFIFGEVRPITEYGIRVKKDARPFVKGQERELEEELHKIKSVIETNKRRDIIDH